MQRFHAFRAHLVDGKVDSRVEQIDLDALSPGEVVIRAVWSDINYKDALAMTGVGKIMRRFPLVGGIDVAGTVHASCDDRFTSGEEVLVTGHGLGEDHDGGYAEYARVPGDWVIPLPPGMDLRSAMALGTAGLTAGLAVDSMETNGQVPGLGPIAVTGATGGVGSLAIDMLAGLGYEVTAVTGKREASAYLRELGATEIIWRDELEMGSRPLEKGLWGGAVDSLGGEFLGWLTRTLRPGGNVASIGLASSVELHMTVLPFILRGVNLLGINSVFVSRERRQRIWRRLTTDLGPRHLERIVTRTVDLDGLPDVLAEYLRGEVTGRTLVRLGE